MIRRPPRSTRKESSAASDVYKRQNDTSDHGCQRVHVSVKVASQFRRVEAFDKFFDFSVSGFGFTHKASILYGIVVEA